jgi:hypothetical protein
MASDISESHTDAISEIEKTEREFEPEMEEIGESPVKQTRFFNISIILERYGDIFSDFDPRPFSVRGMSSVNHCSHGNCILRANLSMLQNNIKNLLQSRDIRRLYGRIEETDKWPFAPKSK